MKSTDDLPNFSEIDETLREIAIGCCAPIFWWRTTDRKILNSGTITFLKTTGRLIGVTAAHVFRGYESDCNGGVIVLQIGSISVSDFASRLIDISDRLDMATFDISYIGDLDMGRKTSPLSARSANHLTDRDAVILCGLPGSRRFVENSDVAWGPFYALGGIHSQNDRDIRYRVEREYLVKHRFIPELPEGYELGGISGGPLIGCFDADTFLNFAISGIISEASASLEYIVATRTDFIRDNGSIFEPD